VGGGEREGRARSYERGGALGSHEAGRGAEFPCPACCQTNARSRGRATGISSGPVVYTFRKSLLLPKPRDVTYRQCKPLCILRDCTSVWVLTRHFSAIPSTLSTLDRSEFDPVCSWREFRPTHSHPSVCLTGGQV